MNDAAQKFEDLIVWRKAHQFVLDVYKFTQKFPKEELFGLTSQFRRAAVSIAANIAEGFAKRGTSEKLRFYNIAQGSLSECRYFIILSKDLGYGETDELFSLAISTGKMLDSYYMTISDSKQ